MAAPNPVRYIDRDVIGPPDQVANVLDNAARRGRLVAVSAARPAADPAKVWVRARFLAPTPGPTARRTIRPRRRTVAVAALAAVVAGALAWLVWLAVQALLALWPVIVGALIVLFLLWLAAGRAGVCCPGLHCPGCKH